MKMLRFFTLLIFLLVVGVGYSYANLHQIPLDFTTIQEAIGASVNGDTILVSPGTYHENLNFLGKNLVLTSFYPSTSDTNFILNTIIDGNGVGSCVKMMSGETSTAKVTGFTLMNGIGSSYMGNWRTGGAVYLLGSSPTIEHNLIKQNETPDGGGGIFSDGGSPVIQYNSIVYNVTTSGSGCGAGILIMNTSGGTIAWNYFQFNTARDGGGLAINGADPSVTRNVISNNTATTIGGGGIAIYSAANPVIINNTISDNTAPNNLGGGVQVQNNSAPTFMNNIVSFSANGGGFVLIGNNTPDLSYNLFYENVGGNYLNCVPGLGDLVGDPAYIGGSPYDYHLTAPSAAIDHGNPDLAYLDPDRTRNDCGAFYYNQGTTTPVVLQSFTAVVISAGVQLNWNTASELECYGWYVQRKAENGEFVNVSSFVPGFGTSVEPHNYSFTDQSVQTGATYSYRLQQIDLGGAVTYSGEITATSSAAIVEKFSLLQNYPNPFNPETVISYTLPTTAQVRLTVYNVSGHLVKELISGSQQAGLHQVTFNSDNLSSGTYICRLEAAGQTFSQLLTLVK